MTTVRKPANHVLHLMLTLMTCGLWGIVWFVMAIVGRKEEVPTPMVYAPQAPYYGPQPPPMPKHRP